MSGGGPKYEPLEGRPAPEALLLDSRKERIAEVLGQRTRNVTVVLDRLEDTFNMAAVLRTCEGMGLQDVHIINNPEARFAPNAAVTQGCDKWLDLHVYEDFASCAQVLKRRGYRVLASAIAPGATSLFELTFEARVAIVLGNERFGVSEEVLRHADGTFWIPMRGFSQSFNISAAASACVTQAIAWRLKHLGPAGDLSEPEKAELTSRFSFLSVNQRGRLYGRR